MSDNQAPGMEGNPYAQPYAQDPQAQQQVPPHFAGYYGYPPHMTPPPAPHFSGAQAGYPPMMPPHLWHQMMWMQHHPAYAQSMMPPPPHWPHPEQMAQMQAQAAMQQEAASPQSDAMFEQMQAVLDGAMGEDAGMFKEILGSLGMNDKEFWKGAMVGAAAALLLSNENVRGKLMDLVAGAGDMLKAGGGAVKETASQTAHNMRDNMAASGEIFRDTYTAGKEGFQESVERHQHHPDTDGEDGKQA